MPWRALKSAIIDSFKSAIVVLGSASISVHQLQKETKRNRKSHVFSSVWLHGYYTDNSENLADFSSPSSTGEKLRPLQPIKQPNSSLFHTATATNVRTFLWGLKSVPFCHNLQPKHNLFTPLRQQMSELSYGV